MDRCGRLEDRDMRNGDHAEVAARFDKAIGERSYVVAMEVDGKALDSPGLAKVIGRAEGSGVQNLVFMIGGSYGLPPAVRERANVAISLSRMTLPHRLARLFLAEQVYRGFSILRNEPYSH